MSLFRKQPSAPEEREPSQTQPPSTGASPTLFTGAHVDIDAIYRNAKLSGDELDRVVRAEELLHMLPSTAAQTRAVVDATFRAFGVDGKRIVEAATKQLEALEAFIRFSHEQTQRVNDAGAKRIAELEAEIARCRETSAQASAEGDERARAVNEALRKVQRVLDFFGDRARADDVDLDADTMLSRPGDDPNPNGAKPPRPPKPTSRPITP